MNIARDRQTAAAFLACFGAHLFLCLGIILAQRPYVDDLGRSINGYMNWSDGGRPLASIIFWLINLGRPAVNVFPLYQFFAIALISVSCVVLARLVGGVEKPAAVALCTLPVGGQIYYLENLSYAFDAPTMALGLLCSVLAAASVLQRQSPWGLLSGTGFFLAALCLYQATTAFYVIVFCFILMRDIRVSPRNLRVHLVRLLSFMCEVQSDAVASTVVVLVGCTSRCGEALRGKINAGVSCPAAMGDGAQPKVSGWTVPSAPGSGRG